MLGVAFDAFETIENGLLETGSALGRKLEGFVEVGDFDGGFGGFARVVVGFSTDLEVLSGFGVFSGVVIDFLLRLWYNEELECFFLDIRPPQRNI